VRRPWPSRARGVGRWLRSERRIRGSDRSNGSVECGNDGVVAALRADQTLPTVRRWSISPHARTAGSTCCSNNAAMAYFNWLEDITDEEWNRDLREEIDLVFFLTRAAWPHLKTSHASS